MMKIAILILFLLCLPAVGCRVLEVHVIVLDQGTVIIDATQQADKPVDLAAEVRGIPGL